MKKTHLIYATSNPGKIIKISRHFGVHGIAVESLTDYTPVKLDPDETGTTLGENADIKALAYARAIGDLSAGAGLSVPQGGHFCRRFCVISDDTGIFIDGLGGETGIKVRRWIGRKMTDEEIISYTLERMRGLKGDARKATFRTVLSLVVVDEAGKDEAAPAGKVGKISARISEPMHFEGELRGRIVETADPHRIEGFPFESLFYATEYGMILGDLHRLPEAEKRKGLFNHRERAIEKAIPVIQGLLKD
jgi:inosine/xanthosine triphosphate pyrophosphatase family protein